MILALGIIIGLLIAILIVGTLTYFRRILETKITVIEKQIEAKGPKPQGYVFEPEDEADEERSEIIAENRRKGRDTKVQDLM